jgi:hypothetical protein
MPSGFNIKDIFKDDILPRSIECCNIYSLINSKIVEASIEAEKEDHDRFCQTFLEDDHRVSYLLDRSRFDLDATNSEPAICSKDLGTFLSDTPKSWLNESKYLQQDLGFKTNRIAKSMRPKVNKVLGPVRVANSMSQFRNRALKQSDIMRNVAMSQTISVRQHNVFYYNKSCQKSQF